MNDDEEDIVSCFRELIRFERYVDDAIIAWIGKVAVKVSEFDLCMLEDEFPFPRVDSGYSEDDLYGIIAYFIRLSRASIDVFTATNLAMSVTCADKPLKDQVNRIYHGVFSLRYVKKRDFFAFLWKKAHREALEGSDDSDLDEQVVRDVSEYDRNEPVRPIGEIYDKYGMSGPLDDVQDKYDNDGARALGLFGKKDMRDDGNDKV